ncbi:hypothetical protein SGQ83_21500 [Flavobacterium sp. Fl-318]|uniref:Uncharacterized protein n=1 Tax=Flavobacterium cupriresistens TaxID=2893885 RepID=A0ABU4RH86_9FLAO|nr:MULTISPECIES: hypothetical protein [unclassified Flavobacterium]MDX6191939.1 hypothetical protein [Flavobacterium sp. Fl-318]UFH44578.1 hypothetical protein LNP23_10300 [Flavobacterium sp. F-323]
MNDDITYGIRSTIAASVAKAIENDSLETFTVLNNFIGKLLGLSVANNSISIFSEYITLPAYYYPLSYSKSKENIKNQKLHGIATNRAASLLSSLLSYSIRYPDFTTESYKIDELTAVNTFFYSGYNGFNRLLYHIVMNSDLQMFDKVFVQFQQINWYNDTSNDLKWNIKSNFNRLDKAQLKSAMALYGQIKKRNDYKRHVISGLNYWIIFLFAIGKMEPETVAQFLEKMRIPADSEEILSDIILFTSNPNMDYLEWSDWDYMERPDGIAYSPPSPNQWLTYGFLVNLIRDEHYYFNPASLEEQELSQSVGLYESLKLAVADISSHFDKWKPILNVEDLDALTRRTEPILQSFRSIKKESINAKYSEIAEENLDDGKISEFRELIGKAWQDAAFIRNLFHSRKNTEAVFQDSKFIGQKTFFEQAKIMFINGRHYQTIYNISQIGGETGRWIDDRFFSSLNIKELHYATDQDISELLSKCINSLKAKKITPNVIILPSIYSYKDENFLNQKKFIRKSNLQDVHHNNPLSKYLLGRYDSIDVYTSFSNVINDKIIVADFENSFKMKYCRHKDWYDEELMVKVDAVTDGKAIEKFESDPQKWTKRYAEEHDLSKDEAISLIKNAVEIEIGSFADFEIVDKDSFVVGIIQNSNLE